MPRIVEALVVGAFVRFSGSVVCDDGMLSKFSSLSSICARATT